LADGMRPDKGGSGSLLVARRTNGTYVCSLDDIECQWRPLKVSSTTDVADARLLRSVEKAHTDTGGIGELVAALGITADPVSMDSQAKYAVLAAGGGDVNLRLLSPSRPDYREKIWDQAAGTIVVEEAGGRVSDLDGKPLNFSQGRTLAANRGVLATNGLLHDALLTGLKQICV
jgi:3'(2'), 5'-bisphosphate nucleotidase